MGKAETMADRPRLVRPLQALCALQAGGVLVLALLAGRFLFLGDTVIELHGYLGSGLFVIAIATVALTLAARLDGLSFGLAVAILALTFAQIGLGYVGRETPDAAAWHIPNGVLLMMLSTYQYANIRFRHSGG